MLFSVASARLLMASLWSLFSKCLQYFDLWRILLQTEIIYNIFPDSAIALDSLFPVRQSPVCRTTRFLFGSALQSSPTAWCVSGRNHHFSQPHRLAELLPGEAFVFVKGMAVDVQGGAGLRVAQQARHRAHIHTLGDEHTGICVPLRYNNDKRKKPLFSRGSRVCRHLFNSFSKLKSDEKNIKKRRLFH